jgi:hypothetical protein
MLKGIREDESAALSKPNAEQFVAGSPLEEAGFEPLVPHVKGLSFPAGKGRPVYETRTISKASSSAGTDIGSAFLWQCGGFAGSNVIALARRALRPV